MNEKTSKTLIGAFVLGALALILIAVAVIGSGSLLTSRERVVFFFDSSIKGLSHGSPVTFRGVPIGRVAKIGMSGDLDAMEFLIPIEVELNLELFPARDKEDRDAHNTTDYLGKLIGHGLRGRLNTQSLLTGQLLIELDFFVQPVPPDVPLPPVQSYQDIKVIPTVPSQFETIWQRIAQLPVDQLAKNLVSISAKIDRMMDDPQVRELPDVVNRAVLDTRDTLQSLKSAADGIRELSDKMATLANTFTSQTPETFAAARQLLERYTQLASSLETSLTSVRGVVGPNTVTVIELNRAVREIAETARAVRMLAGMLERNPESLLRGKGNDRP